MHKKKDYNYIYYFIQLVLVGLLIMFICTYFADVQSTEVFRESKENILNCIYCLLFSLLPFVLKRWNIHSTKTLQVYFLLAIIVHFILGGTLHFYRDVWIFSWIVHLRNSFLIATIIYGILLRHCKNQSKLFMFLLSVAFTALVGVLWEICEYAIDGLSGGNMQRFNNSITGEPFIGRQALQDTMVDLMMDVLGGVLAGFYFAFTNIKGVPLYKFLELKYVKADTNISYQEDSVPNSALQKAIEEEKVRKLEEKARKQKNKIDRKQHKKLYRQEKLKTKKEQNLVKKQIKINNKKQKAVNKNNERGINEK